MSSDDNTRGFDPDEIEWQISQWYDDNGIVHGEDDPPLGLDFQHVDWVTVEFTYPDGEKEWRSWSGPFDDLEDLEDYLDEWYDDESYGISG